MKTIRSYIKQISILLMFLITLQSCVVYHSKTASADEAVQSNNRVKVITNSNDIYMFKKLKKEDGQLYGITQAKTITAKKFSDKQTTEISDSKYVSLLLTDNQIKEIHLKNKSWSTVLTVSVIVVPIGILAAITITSAQNLDWSNVVVPNLY